MTAGTDLLEPADRIDLFLLLETIMAGLATVGRRCRECVPTLGRGR
jgi:hypothetical protein